jgi:hypothetical protein
MKSVGRVLYLRATIYVLIISSTSAHPNLGHELSWDRGHYVSR